MVFEIKIYYDKFDYLSKELDMFSANQNKNSFALANLSKSYFAIANLIKYRIILK